MENNMLRVAKIQELAKVFDATVSEINNTGLHDGTNASKFLVFLLTQFPEIEKYVGTEYYDLMRNELELTAEKKNHREHIKKLWMYPKYEYDQWINVEIDNEILNNIIMKLQDTNFSFEMVNGQVHLCPDSGNIGEKIFDLVGQYLSPNVRQNPESSHVTVVNSNIVSDIGQDLIEKFIQKYNEQFELFFGKIKSTISRDWGMFSLCYVIEVKSDYLNRFVLDFNETFDKKIKPSPHITFAVKPRSI